MCTYYLRLARLSLILERALKGTSVTYGPQVDGSAITSYVRNFPGLPIINPTMPVTIRAFCECSLAEHPDISPIPEPLWTNF